MLANTRSQTPSEADFESFDDLEVPDKETLITTIKKKLLFPSENSAEVKIDLEDAILSLEDLKNRYSLVLQAQSTPSPLFWKVVGTVQGAKIVHGVRSRLYLIAGHNQGYYPENKMAFSYQEGSKVLDICVIFKTEEKALDFETQLRNDQFTYSATQGLQASLNVSSINPIPLNQRIFYDDYNAADYDSPQVSISTLSNQYTIYDPKSELFTHQSIESPKEFGNHCKAQGCHLMSSSHCKAYPSYAKYDSDESNRLALSPLVHGWYDGRDCDVPLFNLILTNISNVRQDGRYRVDLDILALDIESADLLFKRLKEGTVSDQDEPLRRKTHVMVKDTKVFRVCLDWKRKEIEIEWSKYLKIGS